MIPVLTNPTIAALVGGIVGGVIGAIATGVMGLLIGKISRTAATKEKENRLAYAYVVQLNEYSDIRKGFFESLLEKEKELKSSPGQYEDYYPNKVLSSVQVYILNLNVIVSSHEQQALLPQKTVRHYQRYESVWKMLNSHYKMLKYKKTDKYSDSKDKFTYAKMLVFDVRWFFQFADELRTALMEYGNITESDLAHE